ncbi:MAG TPA: MobF family relaxase [Blastocatellia bacterium]|nr:MobF family relaxase [Blastocatellia bacterium]
MLTLSKPLSAGQAKNYHQEQYANGRESYYSERDQIAGQWYGRLAEEWGLAGGVQQEQFERLADGQDPNTGKQLVKHVKSRKQTNKYGEEVTTTEHRAGWDATFSAPKSVSLAALVGGDERIKEAHRESVLIALGELEKFTQSRMGGNKPSQTTGKFAAAIFEHDAARPDQKTGYAAPQLHSHVVIFNMTETAEGRIRALQEREIFRSQHFATAIYRINLAERLQQLGYEIRVDRKGAPQIKGISPEYIDASSPRRRDIERQASNMQARLEAEGVTVKEGAGINQAAALADRRSKKFDREEMKARHLAMDAGFGNQARMVVEQALERGPVQKTAEEIDRWTSEAVTFARDNAMEREAVADWRKLRTDAYRRGLGLTTYQAIEKEIAARQRAGEFVGIEQVNRPKEMTTRHMLDLEYSNIKTVLDARGTVQPIISEKHASPLINFLSERQGVKLNSDQESALTEILTSGDRIIALQGGAGTGKTTVLTFLKDAAEQSGYRLQGLAPTTRAAALLAESGMPTKTLQRFLYEPAIPTDSKNLYVLDESSLSSTRNIYKFFDRLGPDDRILLVGDRRQHQAIQAGSPFEQLQLHGVETAKLTEIVRQKNPELKSAVEKLSERNVREAIRELNDQGRILEFSDDRTRFHEIAKDYAANPENTLVIAPVNRERVAINTLIHQELQSQGVVDKKDHHFTVYVARQEMTGAERTFAGAYQPSQDIIRYNNRSEVYGVRAGEYGRVIEADHEKNLLTVRMDEGREITYDPRRLSGVTVYQEANRAFAVGDQIQFRLPLRDQKVANGQRGKIEGIEDSELRVRLDSGKLAAVDARQFPHFDHGYAVTSYSSQGQTVDRVLINATSMESGPALNDRMAYVAVSRARDEETIYTDSKDDIGFVLDRQVDKQMALEAVAGTSHSSQLNINSEPNRAIPNNNFGIGW